VTINEGGLVEDFLALNDNLMECHVQEDFSGGSCLKEHVLAPIGIDDMRCPYVSACKVNMSSPIIGTCAPGPSYTSQEKSVTQPVLDVPVVQSPMHDFFAKSFPIPFGVDEVHPCSTRTWKRTKREVSGVAIDFGGLGKRKTTASSSFVLDRGGSGNKNGRKEVLVTNHLAMAEVVEQPRQPQ
jgi:hypothetical protein